MRHIFSTFIDISNNKLQQAYYENEENKKSIFLDQRTPTIILFSFSCTINLILFVLSKYYPKGIFNYRIYSCIPNYYISETEWVMFISWLLFSFTSLPEFLNQLLLKAKIEEFLKGNVLEKDICSILNRAKEQLVKEAQKEISTDNLSNTSTVTSENINHDSSVKNDQKQDILIENIAQKLTKEEQKTCLKGYNIQIAYEACFPTFLSVLYKLIINKYFYISRMPYLLRILINPTKIPECALTIGCIKFVYLMHFTKNSFNICENIFKKGLKENLDNFYNKIIAQIIARK